MKALRNFALLVVAALLVNIYKKKKRDEKEIKEVLGMNKYHIALMVYTAVMVPAMGFMTAVV